MSKNYISLEIGGKKRGLPFKAGTLRRIGEMTGDDPYNFFSQLGDNLSGQLKQVAVIIYNSLLANAATKKEEPDFTLEDVQGWVDEMDMEEITLVATTFVNAYVSKPSGEEGANTRAQAAEVAGHSVDSVRRAEPETVGV